ncbi:hypothetical protein CC117_25340 [Parafrankia colletiae]|uniref:Uncharacterized protein n=1 Tax=Parafrankia colletiae TaxID=573497 RepID=A0A1S1QBE3_9ACTN|nr:hypothetical protein [Parafrankia colletiae]OHV32143.1 hypothetical protein CC117_25340 [Parafrankia colletiae]
MGVLVVNWLRFGLGWIIGATMVVSLTFFDRLNFDDDSAPEALKHALIGGVEWSAAILVFFGLVGWWRRRRRGGSRTT